MAIIWGFNLSEMRWNAFSHRNMFDRRWHLRKERFILYQVAMLLALVAECVATYSLSKYENHQTHIETLSNRTAAVHNNDLIDAAIVTIVFCVMVATIFGADFFFLVFWPKRRYPGWYNTLKKLFAVVITLGMLVAALVSTIVVATRAARITGVDDATAKSYTDLYFRPPLIYRHFWQSILWVVMLWLAFIATVAATAIMFIAAAHDAKHGTEPKVMMNDADSSEKNLAHDRNTHHEDPSHNGVPTTTTEKHV